MAKAAVETVDCLIVGAGVIGLAVARALALRGREVRKKKQTEQNETGKCNTKYDTGQFLGSQLHRQLSQGSAIDCASISTAAAYMGQKMAQEMAGVLLVLLLFKPSIYPAT